MMFNRDMTTIEQQRQKITGYVRVQGTYRNLKELHIRLCLQANVYDKFEMIDLAKLKLFKMRIASTTSNISDPNRIFALQQ